MTPVSTPIFISPKNRLEVMRREWQSVARYNIVLADCKGTRRTKTVVATDRTYEDGQSECQRLDVALWQERGLRGDEFGRPLHYLDLSNKEAALVVYRARMALYVETSEPELAQSCAW